MSLASVVQKILKFGISKGSIVMRHALEMTSPLIVMSSSRTLVCSARFGRKADRYCTSLRYEWTCFAHDEVGQFFMWSTFLHLLPHPLLRCNDQGSGFQSRTVLISLGSGIVCVPAVPGGLFWHFLCALQLFVTNGYVVHVDTADPSNPGS